MTSREFTESLAFERLEPDPAEEAVRLLGMLCVLFANARLDGVRPKPEPFTFDDFVPDPYGPSKAERRAAYRDTMMAFAAESKRRKEMH